MRNFHLLLLLVLLALADGEIHFDQCWHVFLDVGANIGQQVKMLFEGNTTAHEGGSALSKMFDYAYGTDLDVRRRSVCALGFEPNPHNTRELLSLEAEHDAHGWRTRFLTETAASIEDGTAPFYTDEKAPKWAHEWASSLVSYSSNTKMGSKNEVKVTTVDLAHLIATRVLSRELPSRPAGSTQPPSVILKIDAEGAEFSLLSRMLSMGVLCRIDFATIEYHDERNGNWIELMDKLDHAPRGFQRAVEYMVKHAGSGCKVRFQELSPIDDGDHVRRAQSFGLAAKDVQKFAKAGTTKNEGAPTHLCRCERGHGRCRCPGTHY